MFGLLRAFFGWLLRALRPLTPSAPRRASQRIPSERSGKGGRSKKAPLLSRSAEARAVEGAALLQIEYAPKRDGEADPGEIVWTWVPYEDDPSQGKDRPVLVIGFVGRRRVGVALTSKNTGRDDHVELGVGAWDREGRVSYAKLDRFIDLELVPIRREGAVLDRARFDGVARALRRIGRA